MRLGDVSIGQRVRFKNMTISPNAISRINAQDGTVLSLPSRDGSRWVVRVRWDNNLVTSAAVTRLIAIDGMGGSERVGSGG